MKKDGEKMNFFKKFIIVLLLIICFIAMYLLFAMVNIQPAYTDLPIAAYANEQETVHQETDKHIDNDGLVENNDSQEVNPLEEIPIDVETIVAPEETPIEHVHRVKTTEVHATCTQKGLITDLCEDCGEILKQIETKKIEHKLQHSSVMSTCTGVGYSKDVCTKCNKEFNYKTIDKSPHLFASTSMTFASPVKNGVNTLECKVCNLVKYEEIRFKQKGDVNLCIPAIEMNAEVVLAECNQKNTDANDISCDLNFINADNPLFFGHDINSFGKLYKLTVGDLIYFTMNGKTETYKIVVSEEGKLVNGGIDIEGLTTGARCLDVGENKTLHFFTCHRTIYRPNGRWIILAELVD